MVTTPPHAHSVSRCVSHARFRFGGSPVHHAVDFTLPLLVAVVDAEGVADCAERVHAGVLHSVCDVALCLLPLVEDRHVTDERTDEAFFADSGVPSSTIVNVLNTGSTSEATLDRIACALGCHMSQLIV